MNREQALKLVDYVIDDSLNILSYHHLKLDARLCVWLDPIEVIAVQSYLPGVTLDDQEAGQHAMDYQDEIGGPSTKPDLIL